MSNQLVITSGAKVRSLEGVITGSTGVLNSLPINGSNGIPQLDSNGKILVSQLPNSVMEYKGTWDAATNTPTLVNGTGNQGDVYLCNVAGTTNFGAGPITFFVGDQVIYSGTIWQRASGASGTVTSVAVTESGDALSITGSPITTSGTINIGFAGTSAQYVAGDGSLITFPSLTGYVPYTGATANLDLGTFDLTTDIVNLNQLKAIGSGGLNIYSNSGTHIALMGGGGGAGTTLYGGLIATTGSFASSGGSDTFAINHSSGSGIALNITKGGSGEGLYINKTSGSGNAATIIGTLNATTLVKSGGTSSQFLKADGSVDSSTYLTTSAASSTYVPYTGATADVDLGTYNLKANSFNIPSAGSTNQLTSFANTSNLFSGSAGLNVFGFNVSNNIYFGKGATNGGVILWTNSQVRYYTLPDADGTVALTSNLSSYLPLSGGTLTGALNGTSIALTGTAGDSLLINHSVNRGIRVASSGSGYGIIINNATGATSIPFVIQQNGAASITLNANGSADFAGALTGTSATFAVNQNSTITNSFQNTNTTNTNTRNILNVTAGNVTLQLQAIHGDNVYISPTTAVTTYLGYNNLTTLSSTGAATFSSSVTAGTNSLFNAGSATLSNNILTVRGGGSSGAYGFRVEANNGQSIFRTDNYTYNVLMCENGGNVGIGTSSPQYTTQITNTSANSVTNILALHNGSNASGTGTGARLLFKLANFESSTETRKFASIEGISTSDYNEDIALVFKTKSYNTDPAERMRITSGGDVLMGKSAQDAAIDGFQYRGAAPGLVQITRAGGEALQLWRYTSNGKMLVFYYAGSEVGSISSNANSLPSDLNFKKDISNISLGLNLINKLRPVHYRHKLDDDNEALSNGIIAQELEQSLLECGIEKNSLLMLQHRPNEKENESQYWVDYTKMIPILVKAIQEQQQQIEELKAKIK